MIPAKGEELKPGDSLTLDYMNRGRDVAGAGRLKVDPATGLGLVVTPFGSFLRALFPPDGWYLVTSAGTASGSYHLREQVEQDAGGWSDGPRQVLAFEANLNASVPHASTVRVWATRRRGRWRFPFSDCS